MPVSIPNTEGTITIEELTSKDGNGVFDKMLEGAIHLLRKEYDDQKIRSTDFVNALVALIPQVLDQANKYSLAKAKLPLELQLLEAEILKTATDTVVATKQGALLEAQASRELAEINRTNTELALKLPKEIALMDKEIALKEAQLPLLQKDLELKAQQLDLGLKDLALKQQQLALAKYELDKKAPTEVAMTQAQADLYKQKVVTEKAQVDDTIPNPNSVIGLNNNLLKEQAKGFRTDSQLKALSLLIETWKVRYNADPDNKDNVVNDINKLFDPNIGKAVDSVFGAVGIA